MNASRTSTRTRTNRTWDEPAFTLIEVMLALAVSAIVLAAIGGVFYSAVRLRERTSAMLDGALPLHQMFGVLRRDLLGALPPGGGLLPIAGDFRSEALGGGLTEGDRLTFFTTTGTVSDAQAWGDVQEVVYELRDSTQRSIGAGRELVRSIYRNTLATGAVEPEEQVLLSNVQSLEVTCYDGMNWRDSWDTSLGDTNLPPAVKVRVQLAGDGTSSVQGQQPYELVVPLLAQSRTNQPASSTTGGG
ncbi:MAG TPA: type II secretion system protein GspJ [Candidatus Dormibacteraeota bacterium]|nr:type II secretion system protein GspJ [Candidatus Dormibacteraeota bacterium]